MNDRDNGYKRSLFEHANAYHNEAMDLYTAGRREDADFYDAMFREAFNKIRAMGWDKEFMGIA